jgi:cell division protein FtsB
VRGLTLALLLVLALLQYPLWLGKGGWLRVWESERRLAGQQETNRQLEARNQALDAEVRDLKQGYEAIEERARFELGLVREGEIFVPFRDAPSALAPSGAASDAGAAGRDPVSAARQREH